MKKFFIILILIFNVAALAQTGWQTYITPSSSIKTVKLSFQNESTGFLMAYGIYKTVNGGINWQQKTLPFESNAFFSLNFVSSLTGFFSGLSSIVYKTSNGGDNWSVLPYTFSNVTAIEFINNNTGWFLEPFYITKTTDCGQTFTNYRITDSTKAFYGLDFLNENTGWACGYKRIYKTTNSGMNWAYSFSTSSFLYKIKFINSLTGFTVGLGIAYKTTDGGNTWTQLDLHDYSYRSIEFINQQTGWIGGSAGALYKTTDTGLKWQKINLDSTANFTDIDFINENTGWLTTFSNKIYKTTNSGTVFIRNTSSEIPSQFELKQNYPNPFNPSTSINYSIRKSGLVKLSIYDISGKEISSLVNEVHQAGSYSVTFNGSAFSSGVYYYKLASENFSETKKMILAK